MQIKILTSKHTYNQLPFYLHLLSRVGIHFTYRSLYMLQEGGQFLNLLLSSSHCQRMEQIALASACGITPRTTKRYPILYSVHLISIILEVVLGMEPARTSMMMLAELLRIPILDDPSGVWHCGWARCNVWGVVLWWLLDTRRCTWTGGGVALLLWLPCSFWGFPFLPFFRLLEQEVHP